MGASHICAAKAVGSSNPSSEAVSRILYLRRASSLAASLAGRGAFILLVSLHCGCRCRFLQQNLHPSTISLVRASSASAVLHGSLRRARTSAVVISKGCRVQLWQTIQ